MAEREERDVVRTSTQELPGYRLRRRPQTRSARGGVDRRAGGRDEPDTAARLGDAELYAVLGED
ncbi:MULTISPECIES: hypothetical protein [Kitasatospora]|uniref:Uncharacterized protein n=2 Tax=Kitasatospora TaxID=2063 RepID=A0ABT1J3D7_9ACTN|nr:hypothetical protein [Kitasatospora paracochleata]MCP2311653.1 hypothetical protein [Kitasatospora paracochleata]